jgi:Polyketide cyclase / dehydrase and lipid transport
MFAIVTTILIALAAIILLLIVVVALLPPEFRVTRLATMAASPAAIFAQVNDFHCWEAWNPWSKLDPNIKQTYDGPREGVGAVYSWVGNGQVGQGRMTIVESRPSDLVKIKLEFIKPFATTNASQFTLEPLGDQTRVTWSMDGHKNFVTKAMGLVMSMDKMIGAQFDKGLADIKSIVEGPPAR